MPETPRPADVFLLSPAFCGGKRGAVLLKEGGRSEPAQRLAAGVMTLGDAFSFVSGLYFRGKLAYARQFTAARPDPCVFVITPTRGLQPPDVIVDGALLREFVGVDLAVGDERYLAPLVRDLEALLARLAPGARAVLLGSVATAKYLEPIADVLGERLFFPRDFVGRGDMSRGALLLQHVEARRELDYVPFANGVTRRGPRAPGVSRTRSTTRPMDPRPAQLDDIDALAVLWYEGWQDAHAAIVPAALARLRTLDSFRDRLFTARGETRVVGPRGAPVGFTILKGDELYQLFVARSARGTGVAATLIADAEQRLAAHGVTTAWLACAIGNDRAARFYEKQGWRRTGVVVNMAETAEGPFPLEVWRYEKPLAG